MTTFSSRLKYALDELRISQSELSRKIGVNRQAIQYLCAEGITEKMSKYAFQISRSLNISPEWLIVGEGAMVSEEVNINKELLHQLAEYVLADYESRGYVERDSLTVSVKMGLIEYRPCTQEDIDHWWNDSNEKADSASVGTPIYVLSDIEEMVKQIEAKSK